MQALRRIDTRWGMNMKRGNQGLSEDILAYNPTNRPDNGEPQIYLFDAIRWSLRDPIPRCSGLAMSPMGTWNAGLANTPGCSTRFCAAWTLSGYPFPTLLAPSFPVVSGLRFSDVNPLRPF